MFGNSDIYELHSEPYSACCRLETISYFVSLFRYEYSKILIS